MPAIIGFVLYSLILVLVYQQKAPVVNVYIGGMLFLILWVLTDIYLMLKRRSNDGKFEKKSGNDKGRST